MKSIWILAKKDLRVLLRDPKAAIILLVMPLVFILVLGVSLGEGFGQTPDERLRVSIVDLDAGLPTAQWPHEKWSKRVLRDLDQSAGIRVELFKTLDEAKQLVRAGRRAAVIVFGPKFSERVAKSSFLAEGINPFFREGVDIKKLDVSLLRDETQLTAVSIIEQVGQGTLLRVVLPWMIGQAFEKIGDPEFIDRLAKDEQLLLSFSYEKLIARLSQSDALNKLELPFEPLINALSEDENLKITVKIFGFPIDLRQVFAKLNPEQKKELAEGLQKAISPKKMWAMLGKAEKQKLAASLQKSFDLQTVLAAFDEEQKKVLAQGLQNALQDFFPKYDLTAKSWDKLTRSQPYTGTGAPGETYKPEGIGILKRGAMRYQLLVPSYLVMFAFFLVLTVGWLFVSERRQGTSKRLVVSPLTRTQILLGKLLPCYMLSLFQGLFLLGAGKLLFAMSWGPQPLWLIAVVATTSLAAMGLALLVAAMARTETQVAIYGTLLVLVLASLSGALMGDRSLMPEEMQQISRVTPHAWALDAYRELLANPGSVDYMLVAQACGVLTAFGIGFIMLAWLSLRLE